MIPRPEPRDLAIAGGIVAAGALIMGVALASLSTPEDFKTRLADLEAKTAEVERLGRAARTPGAYPPDAVCATTPEAAGATLANGLKQDAQDLQLTLTGLDVGATGAEARSLRPLRVRFQASGSYEGAVQLLDRLAKARPQVFAETVDLTSKASSITLNFSGRAFCSA